MATVPKQVELSNRKGSQIGVPRVFNPKRDAMLLQFLRHFQAHSLGVHKARVAEF